MYNQLPKSYDRDNETRPCHLTFRHLVTAFSGSTPPGEKLYRLSRDFQSTVVGGLLADGCKVFLQPFQGPVPVR